LWGGASGGRCAPGGGGGCGGGAAPRAEGEKIAGDWSTLYMVFTGHWIVFG
jgi:hypothetical protein